MASSLWMASLAEEVVCGMLNQRAEEASVRRAEVQREPMRQQTG